MWMNGNQLKHIIYIFFYKIKYFDLCTRTHTHTHTCAQCIQLIDHQNAWQSDTYGCHSHNFTFTIFRLNNKTRNNQERKEICLSNNPEAFFIEACNKSVCSISLRSLCGMFEILLWGWSDCNHCGLHFIRINLKQNRQINKRSISK